MTKKFWTSAQLRGLRSARALGISLESNLGLSESYDSAIAPFVTWAGQIGHFNQAIHRYSNSPNMGNWLREKRDLESKFIARFKMFFESSRGSVALMAPKWISDFYTNLKGDE